MRCSRDAMAPVTTIDRMGRPSPFILSFRRELIPFRWISVMHQKNCYDAEFIDLAYRDPLIRLAEVLSGSCVHLDLGPVLDE